MISQRVRMMPTDVCDSFTYREDHGFIGAFSIVCQRIDGNAQCQNGKAGHHERHTRRKGKRMQIEKGTADPSPVR